MFLITRSSEITSLNLSKNLIHLPIYPLNSYKMPVSHETDLLLIT